jgi:hypoxanthine phosphoribosyltransferase
VNGERPHKSHESHESHLPSTDNRPPSTVHEPMLETLISEAELEAKVSELAAAIKLRYKEEPVLLVCVLKGSLYFLADLSRKLDLNVQIDFIQASSYGSGKSSTGVVQIRKDLDVNIEGLNVIIIEDIVDTGITLSHLRELLSVRRPKSLAVAALLSKTQARKIATPVEFIGFEIPNEFVVGYGLDYAESYRNLPYIAILREG